MSYTLHYSEKAVNSIKSISKGDKPSVKLLKEKIESLEDDPFPQKVKKIANDIYRVRCGDYRIIYSIDGRKIYILCIKRRKEDTYTDLRHIERIVEDMKKEYGND